MSWTVSLLGVSHLRVPYSLFLFRLHSSFPSPEVGLRSRTPTCRLRSLAFGTGAKETNGR